MLRICQQQSVSILPSVFANSISIRLHLYRQVRLVPVLQKLLLAQYRNNPPVAGYTSARITPEQYIRPVWILAFRNFLHSAKSCAVLIPPMVGCTFLLPFETIDTLPLYCHNA